MWWIRWATLWSVPWSIVIIIVFGSGPYCILWLIPLLLYALSQSQVMDTNNPYDQRFGVSASPDQRVLMIEENKPSDIVLLLGSQNACKNSILATFFSAPWAFVCWLENDEPEMPFYYSEYAFELFVISLLFTTIISSFWFLRVRNYYDLVQGHEGLSDKENEKIAEWEKRKKENEIWTNSIEKALEKKEISQTDVEKLNKHFSLGYYYSALAELENTKRSRVQRDLEKEKERKRQRRIEKEERLKRENSLLEKYSIEHIVERKRISENRLAAEAGFAHRWKSSIGINTKGISTKERNRALKWASLPENEEKYL